MEYYPIQRRFGDETYDIREFITKDSLQVVRLANNMDMSSKENFIQSSWDWVIKSIKYPYFTSGNMEIADRHYLENYISRKAMGSVMTNAFITGAMSGIARKVLTGTIKGGFITIARDIAISNGLYSLVLALINSGALRITPEFTYTQYDYWNFPAETLRDMTGDCEDTSNLLCSILRNGLKEDEVFVTVGTFKGYGHAWVTVFNSNGQPIVLETTGDNVIRIEESIIEGYPYEPFIRFNDKRVIVIRQGEEFIINDLNKKNEYQKFRAMTNILVLKN